MTVAEKIMLHLNALPEPLQSEVLDFVEYLETKTSAPAAGTEDDEWSRFSLSRAMRGMEDEPSPYTAMDLKETFG